MIKIINDPKKYVEEMLEGLYVAYPDYITFTNEDVHSLVKKDIKEGKVALATGGGSGHLPLFLGYVGEGMLDGCSVGDVFQSPSAEQMHAVTKYIDAGAGVLYIYGNYNGDIFNFDMAAEMADFEDEIRVESVVAGDDVASGPLAKDGEKNVRRGVAGIVFVYKCAGAAAEKMLPLDEVKRIAEKAAYNTRSMGVSLTACTVPRVGKPGFTIEPGEMEIGMGIHGEPGIRTGEIKPADEIVDELLEEIISDLNLKPNAELAIMVNGLGGTPLDELYIVTKRIDENLKERGIVPFKYYVDEYATALEMAGFSISVLLLDDELKELLSMPADTPFFKQKQL